MFKIINLSIHYSHVRLDYDSIYTIQISSTFSSLELYTWIRL